MALLKESKVVVMVPDFLEMFSNSLDIKLLSVGLF